MQDLLPQLSYYFDISIHEVFYNIASSVQRLEECFLERLPSILMNDSKPIKIVSFIHPDYCEAQARVRQVSARDGCQGERPQSLNPCLELTLKLVATFHHHHYLTNGLAVVR